MQDQCATVDFDYIPSLGIKAVNGVTPIEMNDFVGKGWVAAHLDELWVRNYRINKQRGIKRFLASTEGKGKVGILVGAAPSVLRHIETLKTLSDDFIVIACNTIYTKLVEEGVRVDYVMVVEAHDHVADDVSIGGSAKLIVSPFVCPKVLESWTGDVWLYALGGGTRFQSEIENDFPETDVGGGNSLSTAMCWAYRYLGIRDFVMVGMSLCYYDQYYYDGRTTKHVCDFSHEKMNIKAIDIYGNIVNVTPSQLSYKTWLENFMRHAPNATFINATEDGILGVVPEILDFDGTDGKYTLRYLPWVNIMPLNMAVEAYNEKFKEIKKDGSR